jgi:hypothetical protein
MIQHPATIKDGKLLLQSRPVFDAGVKAMPDGDYLLKLEAIPEGRTLQQLRGLRGRWMTIILGELGYGAHDSDYVYQQIKVACGYWEPKTNPVTGEEERVAVRTRGFSKAKFRQMMEDMKRYVEDPDTGFGIRLPDLDPSKARI